MGMARQESPASVIFSTLALPEHDRVSGWEAVNKRALRPVRCTTFAPEGLVASMRGYRLPLGRLTEIRGRAHVVERPADSAGGTDAEQVILNLLLEGEAYLYTREGSHLLGRGDAFLYPPQPPMLLGFPGPLHQLVVEVPRAVYEQGGERPTVEGFSIYRSVFAGASGGRMRAIVDRLLLLLRTPVCDDDAQEREDALLELMDLVTGAHLGALAGYAAQARQHIRAHLCDASLGVARIAAAVGISERQLARAFAAQGTTVAGTISELRLCRARELLRDESRRELSVAAIAASVGFGSASHFSRAYRQRFGCSAREERSALQEGRAREDRAG